MFIILALLFCFGLVLYYFSPNAANSRLLFGLELILGAKLLILALHWDFPYVWVLNLALWLGSGWFFLVILGQAVVLQSKDALEQLEDNS